MLHPAAAAEADVIFSEHRRFASKLTRVPNCLTALCPGLPG